MLATGGMEAFLARHAVHIVLAVAWAVGTAVAWAAGTSARRAPSGASAAARLISINRPASAAAIAPRNAHTMPSR